MTKSECCKADIIQWFGSVKPSFGSQDLPYQWLCMNCGKEVPAPEKKFVKTCIGSFYTKGEKMMKAFEILGLMLIGSAVTSSLITKTDFSAGITIGLLITTFILWLDEKTKNKGEKK